MAFASWLRYCSDVAQRKPTKLCTTFGPYLAGRVYIHFRRLLLSNGILRGAKFTLHPPNLALSYWQCYCTAVEQWARAKLCGVEHRVPPIFGRVIMTLGIGPHSSFVYFIAYLSFVFFTFVLPHDVIKNDDCVSFRWPKPQF